MFTFKKIALSAALMAPVSITSNVFAMPLEMNEEGTKKAAVVNSATSLKITSVTNETQSKLPEQLRSKYKVGDKVAVLAGTTTTGFGALGAGFTALNDESETKAYIGLGSRVADNLQGHLKADFNKPEELNPSLTNLFDKVIIEGPGPQNQWNTKMFESALKLLKPGGRLDVTVYESSYNPKGSTSIPFATYRLQAPYADFTKYGSWLNGFKVQLMENRMQELIHETSLKEGDPVKTNFGLNLYINYITQHFKVLKPVTQSSLSIVDTLYQDEVNTTLRSNLKSKAQSYFSDNADCGFIIPELWAQPYNLTFATPPHSYISFMKDL